MATSGVSSCEWVSLRSALAHFVTFRGSTQSQRHIKPLHWYVACRLVVEGGFDPDDIVPRPPFRAERKGGRSVLVHDPSRGGSGERTVYGGLKTKNVDVVVTKEGIGPVLAVSCKGAIGAFRNLTNRMEEAVGGLHQSAHRLPAARLRLPVRHAGEPCGGVGAEPRRDGS